MSRLILKNTKRNFKYENVKDGEKRTKTPVHRYKPATSSDMGKEGGLQQEEEMGKKDELQQEEDMGKEDELQEEEYQEKKNLGKPGKKMLKIKKKEFKKKKIQKE